ncbi:MAG: A24 family peptidase [Oscillospiraceae bacterium]
MLNYLLPVITFVLCVISFVILLRDEKTHDKNNEKCNQNKKIPLSKKAMAYSIIMTLITIGVSILFCTIYKENGFWISLKRISLLTMLWPIAYTDFTSYRIPNPFIILGLTYRIIILPLEVLFDANFVWATVLSEVIAAGALFIAAGLCSLCIKNSIGYGDIKLFIVMGLLLSLDGIWGAIFLSLIISFVISVYLLITKKKSQKDTIPFGPAIVIGTYLSVCLSGM